MAELWIKIRHNLASDPKVLSISQELGVDVDLVVGKLVRLWVWLDIVRESEQIPGELTSRSLNDHTSFTNFSQALYRVGWLQSALPPTASSPEDGPYLIPKADKWLSNHRVTKEKHRKYMKKWRDSKGGAPKPVKNPDSVKFTRGSQRVSPPKSKSYIKKESATEVVKNERRRRDWTRAVAAMKLEGPLHTAEFQAVWEEWSDYRALEKKSSLGPRAVPKQIKMLEALGEALAIETINLSIQNGWLGLFPPKTKGGGFEDWRDSGSRVRPVKGKYET